MSLKLRTSISITDSNKCYSNKYHIFMMTTVLPKLRSVTTSRLKTAIFLISASLLLAAGWLATTDNVAIWPVRNTLQYHALKWWWAQAGRPEPGRPGRLAGTVRDSAGQPVAGAWVLVSAWDGTTYTTRSDENGLYELAGVPAGRYRPVAGKPGYDSVMPGRPWGVRVRPDGTAAVDVTLPQANPATVAPGQALSLGRPETLSCQRPLTSSAIRRRVTFDNDGRPNQPTFLYAPAAAGPGLLPILLTVYPGPADSWECASIPLAAAGYVVVAIGPAYSFEPELAVDELERLVQFARTGQFPPGDGSRLAVLGGSYSGLHVQRLIQRDQSFQAAVLLGAPSDLFDMRRRLENGTFIPPFGLDQAMVALGLPGQEPLRYWRYSGAYHVRPDLPPLALLHSRSDEVVPVEQTLRLADNLALVQARHETHFFDGASHYLLSETTDADSLLVYELVLDFLGRYLKEGAGS